MYANPEDMRALLREAAARWELISGIRFEVLSAGNYPDDRDESNRDGIVRVSWVSNTGSFAGRASVRFGRFDPILGYYPYTDGYIELNIAELQTEQELSWGPLSTLTHEIGHLIGLGHSDIPQSLMFANPYNRRGYPGEDDIRAAQALYGPPAQAVSASQAVRDWMFQVPPAADESTTRFIFKKNQHTLSPDGPIVMLDSDPYKKIAGIDASTAKDDYLGVLIPFGNFDSPADIQLPVSMVLLDPVGYVDAIYTGNLRCSARSACITGFYASTVETLLNIPGTWQAFFIANLDSSDPRFLYSTSFSVADTLSYNKAPTARVIFEPGGNSTSVRLRIQAHDEEQDNILLRWHTTGRIADDTGISLYYERNLGPSDVSPWEEIDLRSSGQHILFVEVNDDAERYTGSGDGKWAGEGYRTLLRITVNLPLTDSNSVSVISSSNEVNSDTTQHLVAQPQTYQASAEWPLPFSGVAPDPLLKLGLNNIGVMNDQANAISTCIETYLNGVRKPIDGKLQMDIGFRVTDLNNGVIQLSQARAFNSSNSLTKDGFLPECSGSFDFFTGVYSDTLQFGGKAYRVQFMLENSDVARFRLMNFEAL
ncbi:MAG: matrixin family metalloprotease [Pseudomonadales bacterium]|nr:matrixin family metalloprotease [Pseudomonadales bacterium]